MTISELPLFPAEVWLWLTTSTGRPSIWQARLFQSRGEAAIRLVNVIRKNVAMAIRPEELQNVTLDRGRLCLESDTSDEIIGRWMTSNHLFDPREPAAPGENLLFPSEARKPLDEHPSRPPNF